MSTNPTMLSLVILPPCERVGVPGDWWAEQHVYCTGSQHVHGVKVGCACSCHNAMRVVVDDTKCASCGWSRDRHGLDAKCTMFVPSHLEDRIARDAAAQIISTLIEDAKYQEARAESLWHVLAGRNDAVERAMRERDDARASLNLAVTCAVDAALVEIRRQGGPEYLLKEARSEGIMAARVYGYSRT